MMFGSSQTKTVMSQPKFDVIIGTGLCYDKGKLWCDNYVLKSLAR